MAGTLGTTAATYQPESDGGWFRSTRIAPGVWHRDEPAVNLWFRAALVTVEGRDADLQVDFGCGLVPVPRGQKPVIAVATHAHVDHIGGFHAFADRRGHAAEAAGFAGLPGFFTFADDFRAMPDLLQHPPHPGFRQSDWQLLPAPLTATLAEGDRIDLGDRVFTVLHLPGHSPGSIGLLDEACGLLISGDAIDDDELLDDLPGSSIPDYLATMERLRQLDCRLVIGGHGAAMDRARMVAVAEGYLRAKSSAR